MNLLIATGNKHKFQELSNLLATPHLNLINLQQLNASPQVVEDGDTFEANASKKAVTLALFSRMWTLADDSGLEVEALNGAPGIYSARYAGEPTDDIANNHKIMDAMKGVLNRKARFCCAIALSDPQGNARIVTGVCEGRLLDTAQGGGGFGYDPLFIPNGYHQTFAELPAELKNTISHRGCAIKAALEAWQPYFKMDLPVLPS